MWQNMVCRYASSFTDGMMAGIWAPTGIAESLQGWGWTSRGRGGPAGQCRVQGGTTDIWEKVVQKGPGIRKYLKQKKVILRWGEATRMCIEIVNYI